MLVAKRSVGIAPEVQLRIRLHAGDKAIRWRNPSWLWQPWQTSPEVQSTGISARTKRTDVLQKCFKKAPPKHRWIPWLLTVVNSYLVEVHVVDTFTVEAFVFGHHASSLQILSDTRFLNGKSQVIWTDRFHDKRQIIWTDQSLEKRSVIRTNRFHK